MNSDIVKLPTFYYGKLWVETYAYKNSSGERVFNCKCSCGEHVERSEIDLHVRRLQCCESCRLSDVSVKIAKKDRERAKDHRRNNPSGSVKHFHINW